MSVEAWERESVATKTGRATIERSHARGIDGVFKALASEQRREILRILGEATPDSGKTCCSPDELCGCKLSDRLGIVPSTISHHMAVLRAAGLVSARRDGKWVYYSLCRDALDAAAHELRRL
jgi:ArsR family transcriptional regulator